jgi:hypothetical protein
MHLPLEEVSTNGSLQALLNAYYAAEPLADVACEQCKAKHDATKITKISQCPDALIISLGRFQYVHDKGIIFISTLISLPMELDLKPYETAELQQQNLAYDLVGVVCYSCSHYTSFAKDFETGIWNRYDDKKVEEMQNVVQSTEFNMDTKGFVPYILFYQKKAVVPATIQIIEPQAQQQSQQAQQQPQQAQQQPQQAQQQSQQAQQQSQQAQAVQGQEQPQASECDAKLARALNAFALKNKTSNNCIVM